MQEQLKAAMAYSPETGLFYWRARRGSARAGDEAGCINTAGYRVIRFNGRLELAHRLAWLYVHGEWPPYEVDHINGDTSDNRIENLRQASHAENSKNLKLSRANTSGLKGVHLHRQSGRWRARIKSDGRSHSLGLFNSKEDAHQAYREAAQSLHGQFARFV